MHRLRYLQRRVPVGHADAGQGAQEVRQVLPLRRQPRVRARVPDRCHAFVAWRDLRAIMPVVKQGIMPASTTTNCSSCHTNQL